LLKKRYPAVRLCLVWHAAALRKRYQTHLRVERVLTDRTHALCCQLLDNPESRSTSGTAATLGSCTGSPHSGPSDSSSLGKRFPIGRTLQPCPVPESIPRRAGPCPSPYWAQLLLALSSLLVTRCAYTNWNAGDQPSCRASLRFKRHELRTREGSFEPRFSADS
jgi:hypothetical protein